MAEERKNHKYIARIKSGDGFRYFYSKEELNTYLHGNNKVDEIKNRAKQAKENVENKAKQAKENVENKAKQAKDEVDKRIEEAKRKIEENRKRKEEERAKVEKEKQEEAQRKEDALHPKEKEYREDPFDQDLDFPTNAEAKDEMEMQAQVNPNYDPYEFSYSNNCAFCTATYDLIKRGYDVEANPVDYSTNNDLLEIKSWYEGAEWNPPVGDDFSMTVEDEYKTFCNKKNREYQKEYMLSQGEGARGNLALFWNQGGGHSVSWEVKNGEVIIRDCQVNQEFNYDDFVYFDYTSQFLVMRTDNHPVNEENIYKVARARK